LKKKTKVQAIWIFTYSWFRNKWK